MSGSAPNLRRTQELVWALISAPEGVARGAAELVGRGALESADLSFLVRGDERLDPTARLDIYAGMYFFRLRDCLADDFPHLTALLGGARFHNLVTDYLLVHPPSHPSLRWLGARLPGFLAGHALAAEFPCAADLARLEWARLDVFDEDDAPVLTRATWMATEVERFESQPLVPVPAFRLLALEYGVAPLWRALEDRRAGAEPGGVHSAAVTEEGGAACHLEVPPAAVAMPGRRPSPIRVWRRDLAVYHRGIAPDEAACLGAMARGGATLPQLCETVLAAGAASAAEATQRMAALVELWLEDGLLRAWD